MRSIVLLIATLLLGACGGSPEEEDDYADRMSREHARDRPVPSPMAKGPEVELRTERVAYGTINGRALTGYLARPAAATGPRPGILVIHEWWGLNEGLEGLTRKLASEGYVALAVDLYGGTAAATPEAARAAMDRATKQPQEIVDNLKQGAEFLRGAQGAPRVGVIGWCFGGGWALQAGLQLPELIDAVVMFYGQVEEKAEKIQALDAPLIGFFGGKDLGIPVSGVRAFETQLKALGKNAQIHIYPNADHAFASPSAGKRYDAAAASDAWSRTRAFFATHLK